MPTLNIQIATEKIETADYLKPGQDRENIKKCADYLNKIAVGKIAASVDIADSSAVPAAASATLTFVSVIATDVFVIGPVTFTATSVFAQPTFKYFLLDSTQPQPKQFGYVISVGMFTARTVLTFLPIPKGPPSAAGEIWKIGLTVYPTEIYRGFKNIRFTSFS